MTIIFPSVLLMLLAEWQECIPPVKSPATTTLENLLLGTGQTEVTLEKWTSWTKDEGNQWQQTTTTLSFCLTNY